MTKQKNSIKILVIGDLHGQMPKIYFKNFDAIIAPGDFCFDKNIRKYIDKSYKQFLINPNYYTEWWDIIGKNKAKRLINESILYARKILEKLNSYNVPVYVIPGNWDFAIKNNEWNYLNKNLYKEYIIKGLKNIIDTHNKIRKLKNNKTSINIMGYGLVNGPELLKYRMYDNITLKQYKNNAIEYKKLLSKYNKLFSKLKNKSQTIFLSHNVPFNTKLDKIVNKTSPMNGYHYGSNLARDIIIKHKPLITISGHMHEHYGTCKIGKTTILNAGYGGDKSTLIEISNGKIKNIKFHGKRC
ncbi:MAG: metallophosphoesterase family protein [Candidatus Woesearchaeota archaeon]